MEGRSLTASALIILLLAAPATSRGPAAPWFSMDCTAQDPYACVNLTGCGFCLTTWTCMPGDENGTALGALPCEPNSTRIEGGEECAWMTNSSAIDGCSLLQQHPPKVPFHMMVPPQTLVNQCVPPEWDTLCVAGGRRYWDGCFIHPISPRQCQDFDPDFPKPTIWGGQWCECPHGRNGRMCEGCSTDAGCTSGNQSAISRCHVPSIYAKPESDDDTLHGGLGLSSDPVPLACKIKDPHNISIWVDAGAIIGFGPQPIMELQVAVDSVSMKVTKAVDFPYSHVIALKDHPSPDYMKGTLMLGGISFVAEANNSQHKYVSVDYGECPQWEQHRPPWMLGSRCTHWHIDKSMSKDLLFANTPPDISFRASGGWRRYPNDMEILSKNLKPPLDLYCMDPNAVNGSRASFPHATTQTFCALRGQSFSGLHLRSALIVSSWVAAPHPAAAAVSAATARGPTSKLGALLQQSSTRTRLHVCHIFAPLVVLASMALMGSMMYVFCRCYRRTRRSASRRRDRTKIPWRRATSTSIDCAPLLMVQSPPQPLQSPSYSPPHANANATPNSTAHPESSAQSSPPSLDADGAQQPTSPPSTLSWHDVSYRIGRSPILPRSSARVTAGLWALLGPSGAGKSTLLGVLAGRKTVGDTTGEVRLHGYRASASVRRARLGYVTQDDILPSTSTAYEHLMFHARLRAPWLRHAATRALVEARSKRSL